MISVIDADHIFYNVLHGIKKVDEFGQPILDENGKLTYDEKPFEQACNEADLYITSLLNKTESTGYIGYFGGSSISRKKIYPDYKANRKDLEPLKNLTEMKHYLKDKWKFIWLSVDIARCIEETDDYVVSTVRQLNNSFIVSPDKDLLSLKGRHFNPKKDEWVEVTEQEAKLNFWTSMITGDNSDNIKGIPGKGIKFAEKLFSESRDFELDTVLEYCKYFRAFWGAKEFLKNYECLFIKENLDIPNFNYIEWTNTILND